MFSRRLSLMGGFGLGALMAATKGMFGFGGVGLDAHKRFTESPQRQGRGRVKRRRWWNSTAYSRNGQRECARRRRQGADMLQMESHLKAAWHWTQAEPIMPRHIVGLGSVRYEREQAAADATGG